MKNAVLLLAGLSTLWLSSCGQNKNIPHSSDPHIGIEALRAWEGHYPDYAFDTLKKKVNDADEYVIVITFSPQPHHYEALMGWNNGASNYEYRSSKTNRKTSCETKNITLDIRVPETSDVFSLAADRDSDHPYYTIVEVNKGKYTKTISYNVNSDKIFREVQLVKGYLHGKMIENCDNFETQGFPDP